MVETGVYIWLFVIFLVCVVIYRAKRHEDEELKHIYTLEKLHREQKEEDNEEQV